MVTKTITPALESTVGNGSPYVGYDFGQVNLDIIQFESSMFETFMKHDFASLQAVDEASIQVINEMTFKEAIDKLFSFIDSIVDKVRAVIRKAITNIQAKFNVYGKFAKKMREQINASVSWEDKPGEKVEGRAFVLDKGPSTIVNLISLKFADDVVKKVAKYSDSADPKDLEPVGEDFDKYYMKSKDANSIYDAMKDDIAKSGEFSCTKSKALELLGGVDQGNMIIKLYKTAEANVQRQFADIKKSLKSSVKDARSEKDKDQLQMLANVQKVVSKYASMANRMMSAGYSAVGYGISGNMKLVNAIASKCMGKVSKANKLNSETIPPEEKDNFSTAGAVDGDYKEVKEAAAGSSWSGTENGGESWENDASDAPDDDESVEESSFGDFDVFGMILEGDCDCKFIEPGDPPVDETEPQIDPEKDNYVNDPEDDDARPDLMDDSDATETVTSEGYFDDIMDDFFFMENEFIEPGNPPVDETEQQHDPEKDNYVNDPEDDDARPDLMDDSDATETVTSEGYFDDVDSFFNEDDLL